MPTTMPAVPEGSPPWVANAVLIIMGVVTILTVISLFLIPVVLKVIADIKSALAATKATSEANSARITDLSRSKDSINAQLTTLAQNQTPPGANGGPTHAS